MTRFAFFAFLTTLATKLFGQTTITPCQPRLQFGPPPPKNCNGQCPNVSCTYIAPPWTWVIDGEHFLKPSDDLPASYIPSPNGERDSRILRCPQCNTAYWQDAEGAQ